LSPKAESGAQVDVKACTSAKDAGGYPEETTTRVIPLGKIVVGTEAAPASHGGGAGITVPAPPAHAESMTPWAIATGLADAPVALEGVARARITSAETRQPAKGRSDPARRR
jgi:hypothetical protein